MKTHTRKPCRLRDRSLEWLTKRVAYLRATGKQQTPAYLHTLCSLRRKQLAVRCNPYYPEGITFYAAQTA